MHLLMLLIALGSVWCFRWYCSYCQAIGQKHFSQGIALFLFPPLLLLTTALAIFCMGPYGSMVWGWEGWFSYALAIAFLLYASILLLKLAWQGRQSLKLVRSYPLANLKGMPTRIVNVSLPFSCVVGFWTPELVVSQGLLDTLDLPHLEAVLTHEKGHLYYRDTFCFFWLGWLRCLTSWLPNTESLWQEMLLWREIRADRWAAFQIDNILLAEALLLVVNSPVIVRENFAAAFANPAPPNRLVQRIETLLQQPKSLPKPNFYSWLFLMLGFCPLLAIPFHY